jgi:hypothetical protein
MVASVNGTYFHRMRIDILQLERGTEEGVELDALALWRPPRTASFSQLGGFVAQRLARVSGARSGARTCCFCCKATVPAFKAALDM